MYSKYLNQNPSSDTVLSCVYNNSCQNIKILKNSSAQRVHTLLDFMKKNNIIITKEKILFICHLFDNYRNMKFMEDKYNFVNEIDIVRNKKILDLCMKIGTFLGLTIIESYSSIKNLSEETKEKIKKYKWLIIILIFFVISCIIFYHYTYNYMKDEFTYNNDIIKYINSLDNINRMYLYVPNIKDIKSITLYRAMLDKLNIEHINKYNSFKEYLSQLNKNKPKTEIVPEAVPEIAAEVMPEIAPEVMPEIAPEVMPEIAPEVMPEIAPEVMPEIAPEVMPEVVPEIIQEENPEVMPEVVPEVKQKKEVKNKKDIKQKRQYNKKK